MKRTTLHDRIADEALGKADEDFIRYVRKPENLDEWNQHLIDLKGDVERQLAEKKAELDAEHTRCIALGEPGKQIYFRARDEFQTWKASAIRFKQSIEHRLGEVKRLRRERRPNRSDQMALLVWAASLIPNEGDGAEWHQAFEDLRR